MARSQYHDFLQNCWFQLFDLPEISVLPTILPTHMAQQPFAGFNYVAFPSVTLNHEEIREGVSPWTYKVPTGASIDQITLRKGMSAMDNDFYNWVTLCAQGAISTRRSLVLFHLDRRRYARRIWALYGCMPQTYRGGDFDAASSDISIEELVLSVNHMIQLPLFDGFPMH